MKNASLEYMTVAMLFDRVPPWLVANFNAAARHMNLVIVEATAGDRIVNAGQQVNEQFRREVVPTATHKPAKPDAGLARRVADTLDKIRPDVVVALGWSGQKSLGALAWGCCNDVPVIVVSDSTAGDYSRSWLREHIKRRLVRLFSAAWAAGSLSARYLVALGMPRERIITGPVDTIDLHHFSDGAERARRTADAVRSRLALPKRYFLAASRFSPEKNLSGLLRGYARYRARTGNEAWHLVLIGDGALKPDIMSLIGELDLEKFVLLPGFIAFESLPEYYGLASAFVHASQRDTWAVVVNEAMAAGLPVIVSNRCGCVPDLLRDGINGFVIDPNDPDQLADRMWQLSHGGRDHAGMGREGRKTIAGWSPDNFGESLKSIARLALSMPVSRCGITTSIFLRLLALV